MYHSWIVLKYFLIIRLFLDFCHLEDQREQVPKWDIYLYNSVLKQLYKLMILQRKEICV